MYNPDKNIIISLFDFSGHWPKPYLNAGYEVIKIDIKTGTDILNWDYSTINKDHVFGILAAPPCTHFSKASSIHWFNYDVTGKTASSLLLIQTTLQIIHHFKPIFWALENPPGRLSKIYPPIAPFKLLRFEPWEFGDPFFKQTEIYGEFIPHLIKKPVKPIYKVTAGKNAPTIMQYYKKKYPGQSRAAYRSITPSGFAQAFFNANRNLNFEKSIANSIKC
jgi:site-specific DNA-cytosine methylase